MALNFPADYLQTLRDHLIRITENNDPCTIEFVIGHPTYDPNNPVSVSDKRIGKIYFTDFNWYNPDIIEFMWDADVIMEFQVVSHKSFQIQGNAITIFL